MNIKPKR